MTKIILLLLFYFCVSFTAIEPISLSFNQLENRDAIENLNQKKIQVRGFLYRNGEDRLILSADADLKSCCVGSQTNISRQIIVQGDLKPSSYTLNVEGIFIIAPAFDEKNDLKELYFLKEAKIIPNQNPVLIWVIIGIICVFLGMKYLWNRKAK